MTTQTLTKVQEEFLDECLSEFSDKYTDQDLEYAKTFDEGVPAPPLIYPWFSRTRGNFNRDRGSGRSSYRSGYHDRDGHNNRSYGHDRNREYGNERRYENSRQHYGNSDRDNRNENRRFQPY